MATTPPPTAPIAATGNTTTADSSFEQLTTEITADDRKKLQNIIHRPPFKENLESLENGPYQHEETIDLDETLSGAEDGQQLFESNEHDLLARDLILYFPKDGDPKNASFKIWQSSFSRTNGSEEKIDLTFGRFIALAGDYYTTYDEWRSPICGAFYHEEEDIVGEKGPTPDFFKQKYDAQEKRFTSAVESLIGNKDGYLAKVLGLIDKEHEGVELAYRSRSNVALAYHNHSCGIPTDFDYFLATKTTQNASLSFYTWLAFLNVDHFARDAVTCYSAGHAVAMDFARAAADATSENAKNDLLKRAYINEAFAAHYLTDLFSSGHLRNPRRSLHCQSALTMSKSVAAVAISGLTKTFINHYTKAGQETPIWDHQSHYMHDDDCTTGLLVQNAQGHQWISYGDKQLKEAPNRVNVARAKHCLQLSVNELYEEGFKKRRKMVREEFTALEWIPQPMLAAASDPWTTEWGGYDRHNPAPLWIVESQEKDNESWTYRKTINDHSDFTRAQGAPGTRTKVRDRKPAQLNDGDFSVWEYGGPTQECNDIQNAPFRGSDQKEISGEVYDLRTGGFIQIQDLDFGLHGERTCINFWGPVKVKVGNEPTKGASKNSHELFTLRSRSLDVDKRDYPSPGGVPSIKPMHWLKWWDGKRTSIARLDWAQKKTSSEVTVSLFEISDPCWKDRTQVVEFDPHTMWNFECKIVISQYSLSEGLPCDPGQANLSRFLIGRFSEDCKISEPELISVTIASQGSSQISICRLTPDKNDRMTSSQSLDYFVSDGQVCFIKKFQMSPSQTGLLITKLVPTELKKARLDFCLLQLDKSLKATHVNSAVDYSNPTLKNFSVLTGDVYGQGKDSVVAITTDHLAYTIRTYDVNPDTHEFHCSGTHRCNSELQLPVIRRYTLALLPSGAENQGLNVLSITIRNKAGSPVLIFRTHKRSAAGPSLTATSNPWGEPKCHDSEPIPDNLYHGYKDQTYFHIKWLRCNYVGKNNAVMEVFSWYGVLGMRLFAPGPAGHDYKLVSTMPYMGQTSIGMGLGSYNDWGYGIMSWGCTEDFVDENVWTCTSADRLLDGSWGMRKSDAMRPNIRGWEVKKRPF